MMSIKSITFFFPYPFVSGVPILFANIANHLLKTTSIPINIIDYKEGALIRNCGQHPNLNFIEFRDFKTCNLDFETYLLIQAGIPYKMRSELKIGKNVRMLQWVAFEYNLVPYIYQLNAFRKLQEKYFSLYLMFWYLDYNKAKILSKWTMKMIERGSIAFMSRKMYDVTHKYLRFDRELPVTYLPLVSGGITDYSEENILQKAQSVTTCLQLAWVGRIADFKVHILNYSIKLLSRLAVDRKININFHIIGDGEFVDMIQLDCENDFFTITNVGGLEKDKSDTYIYENVHALLAMGTSSIDGARVGLPVVLLDYSYVPVTGDYLFRWLHDTTNYDLGHPMIGSDFSEGNSSIGTMVTNLLKNYIALSGESLGYYRNNHSTEHTSAKLLDLLLNHSYTHSEVPVELKSMSIPRKLYLWYVKIIKKKYY